MRFKLRIVPMLVSLTLMALGLSLAQWQTRRADEKDRIFAAQQQQAKLPAQSLNSIQAGLAEVEYRRYTVTGEFLAGWPVYLDNRPLHGVSGFIVLMPFKLSGEDKYVMVARGWQPRDPQIRAHLIPLQTPAGQVQIEGVVRKNLDRVMQLGSADSLQPAVILQNLDLSVFATQTRLPMLDFILQQTSDDKDGLLREWNQPTSGADKHKAYAFQWYGLTLMTFIFFVVTGLRSGKNSGKDSGKIAS